MRGNVPIKIARLVANLALNPRYIPRCVNHNIINGRTPVDLEMPWFSYAAIDFLERFMRPEMTVCEYGSGGSTLFFARRARSVFSIENSEKWFDLVLRRLQQNSLNNVTIQLHPFDFKNPAKFE
ncbi:MAG TPA: hypothetical protein VFM25_03400, partial [Verrucomicrobiae bacterium]|nr:hypothetical protein [Verrucomicrobiae bacterium]